MPDVGVRELKARATEIVREVREEGARYVITFRGRPVACLTPLGEVEREAAAVAGEEAGRLEAARAVSQIESIRRRLAGWRVDATRAVVDSHEEEG